MSRALSAVCLLALVLFASPAQAQPFIPAGVDVWSTGNSGQTYFNFPDGDVESLCGAAPDPSWNHVAPLVGVPTAADSNGDTAIERLDTANFRGSNSATVRIVVANLHLASQAPHQTPCGEILWDVVLAGAQRVNNMTIVRSTSGGGVFFATISVDVEFRAVDTAGNYLGSLFYAFDLPDPAGSTGTPWSFIAPNTWLPGRATNGSCLPALRKKLENTPKESQHYYCIEGLIASGKCTTTPECG